MDGTEAAKVGLFNDAAPISAAFAPWYDTKHTTQFQMNKLQPSEEQGSLQQMVWPPQGPDLNITESVSS